MDYVILVDNENNELGTASKLDAHNQGLLHRAFSIVITNDNGEILIQQRSFKKYHSSGLWSNACCSHPLPGEDIRAAAKRRLQEELGIQTEQITAITEVLYNLDVGDNMVEHEYNHLFHLRHSDTPTPNPAEVHDTRWISWEDLNEEIDSTPEMFTSWFRHFLSQQLTNNAFKEISTID